MRPALLWVQMALLGASLAACRSTTPAVAIESASAPLPPDDLPLTLTCTSPSFKNPNPELVLKGTCPLPDGVILKLVLTHLTEEVSEGVMRQHAWGAGSSIFEINHGAFSGERTIAAPGTYAIEVSLPEDLQEKHLVEEVRKEAKTARAWKFEFFVQDPHPMKLAGFRLSLLHFEISQALSLLMKFESFTVTPQAWAAGQKALLREAVDLQRSLENSPVRSYYPAASRHFALTLDWVINNSRFFGFRANLLLGPLDRAGNPLPTLRGEKFSWETMKRYVEESYSVGGREFCLWTVKDLRRTQGIISPETLKALQAEERIVGVAPWAARLKTATLESLDALEAEIRNEKAATLKEGEKH